MASAPDTWWLGERSWHGGCDEIPLPTGRGRLWLCGKRFVGSDPDEALAEVGGDHVVCLCEEHELKERYPDYVDWLSGELGRATWFPIPDVHAPDLRPAVDFLDQLQVRLSAGEGLIMHCGAGIGRAGTMAAALLIRMGQSLGEALSTVAAHRPMAGPEAGAQQTFLVEVADLAL
jgi:Cyclin-dependent kinase inhibitor 3 (CDKN3)